MACAEKQWFKALLEIYKGQQMSEKEQSDNYRL